MTWRPDQEILNNSLEPNEQSLEVSIKGFIAKKIKF